MQDRIEKSIDLKAPVARVWRAITDYTEFSQWFRVKLDGPFVVGELSRGHMTYPGHEHMAWLAEIRAIDPDRLFSLTWHPCAVEVGVDYSNEPSTLVEFSLEPIEGGTRLHVVESGFSSLPESRYANALRSNESGWTEQMKNIQSHVES